MVSHSSIGSSGGTLSHDSSSLTRLLIIADWRWGFFYYIKYPVTLNLWIKPYVQDLLREPKQTAQQTRIII